MTATGFRPAGLITLTTDFGLADPFVGIMKGRILGRLPGATLVDITHDVPPQRADLGGFWLGQSWREFPPGTVHVAVVDPGVGTGRRVLLAETGEHCFLGPDNGLLAEALRGTRATWRSMDPRVGEHACEGRLSNTFHGRDLFAPLAAELASGRLDVVEFGPLADPLDPAPLPTACAGADGIEGHILLADRFGNLVSNIGAGLLDTLDRPIAHAGGRSLPLVPTYAAAAPGSAVAVINAFNLLELAVVGGRADAILGVGPGEGLRVRDGSRT